MVRIKAHRTRLLLAGSLAAAVTALAVTACGGGAAGPAQGSAPGQWTPAEVSQFTAAGGSAGSDSENSCIIGYFEQDMSFGNAMAVAAVESSAPSAGLSPTQVKAALVSKYGTTAGDAISAQFGQVLSDSVNNCSN
jgi:hypothetical protein